MIGKGLYMAALKGIMLPEDKILPNEVGIGQLIHTCVYDSLSGLNTKNTIFGTILLYVPLTVALAAVVEEDGKFRGGQTRKWLRTVLDQTTVEDTIQVYRAFSLVQPKGDLNKVGPSWTEIHDRYDFNNPKVYENIEMDQISLQHLFTLSSDVDPICREWSEYYRVILEEAFPYLDSKSKKLEDLEEGIVDTFIWLLSKYRDGLIIRKAGVERAEEVRLLAERIMTESSDNPNSNDMLSILDKELGKEQNTMNPGTTADLLSAAILCKLASMAFD